MATDTMNEMALNQGMTFCWHEVYTKNAQASIDFYTQALDFGTTDMDMGEMGKYRMLTKNGKGVCGVFQTDRPDMADVPPHWAVYHAVDNVDERLKKCESLGAKTIVPPMDIPTVGRMAMIQDPQGAHIWLFQPEHM